MSKTEYDIPSAESDFVAELEDDAAEVMTANPGMGYLEWRRIMLDCFPLEIADAFGAGVSESDLEDLFENTRRKISPLESD